MLKVDVCLTPELLPLFDLKGKIVVVVDIFRATSTMVTALAHGVERIKPVRKLEECLQYREKGYLVAAEREGQMAAGFDLGNSPFSYMEDGVAGRTVALTTTNGTQAIALSHEADAIVAGAFLNISRVARFIFSREQEVVIVCAGWKGQFNMEDTLFAGALIEQLYPNYFLASDAAKAALRLYHDARLDLFHYLSDSSHVQRLRNIGIEKDIAFCLSMDQYGVLPILRNGFMVDEE